MRSFIFLLLLIFSVTTSYANEANLLKSFKRPQAFRSSYVEEKHLPSLSSPLISQGDFIYIKDRGLAWIMREPFSMQTVITPRGLVQWVEGEKQQQSAQVRKAMIPILDNISAIFDGDYDALYTEFEIQKTARGDISLKPKSQHLKPYLQEIIIGGTKTIKMIKIINAPDKFTVTTFGKPDIGMKYITDAEDALFDE